MNKSKFQSQLADLFVNRRGELCAGVAKSRSKVAVAKRAENTRAALVAERARLAADLRKRGRSETLARRLAEIQAKLAAL